MPERKIVWAVQFNSTILPPEKERPMNRREFIAALATATVATPLVPALAVKPELPLKTLNEINTEFAAQTQRMMADGTNTVVATNL